MHLSTSQRLRTQATMPTTTRGCRSMRCRSDAHRTASTFARSGRSCCHKLWCQVGSNEPTDSQLALITGSSQNSGTSLIEGGHTVETTQPRLADTLDGYLYVGGLVVMVTVLAAVEPSASFRVMSVRRTDVPGYIYAATSEWQTQAYGVC